ncbi:MAG: response regulator [Anaerolineae bacterium]|nr:MAG: response regulator [Anaerolineae bacterium]
MNLLRADKRGRLLLVDDDPDISEMLRTYFNIEGYDVLTVEFGQDALRICQQERPDLILLDINLPDLDGYEVCRRLKDDLQTSSIPIIFVSQRDQQADKIHGLRIGGDDFITKPFRFDELSLRVQNVLARLRYRRQVDPSTGQPGGILIEERLKTLLARTDWALLYVGVDGYERFSDTYGFLNAGRLLSFVATILQTAADRLGGEEGFVGHVGKGDFVVIVSPASAQEVARTIKERFRQAIATVYRRSKAMPRALAMDLCVGIVWGDQERFADIRTLAEAASAARRRDRLGGKQKT